MELFLAERGFQVTNLGPCCPKELTFSEAQKTSYDVIIISSVNGHAVIEAPEILNILRTAGIATPVAIGGKLDTSYDPSTTKQLQQAGFDGVFLDTSSSLFEDFVTFLEDVSTSDTSACSDCTNCTMPSKAQTSLLEGGPNDQL